MYVYVPCPCIALERKKKVYSILELELRMALSYCVGAGNQTEVLWKSSHCSYPVSHLSRAHSSVSLLTDFNLRICSMPSQCCRLSCLVP